MTRGYTGGKQAGTKFTQKIIVIIIASLEFTASVVTLPLPTTYQPMSPPVPWYLFL